ncbi:hypothetical protein [Marinobacter sp. F3R08]|uniref:HzsA-related protein n=1 Tax=Marinobacter sp. F3R08 TaxID=2841559 RepID=UPI001C09159A|nr:hypothetical protein [Marinobacter sp. F3R08]MBU2955415.1 hypothetical protein [Marinobacter sp. F3R08]
MSSETGFVTLEIKSPILQISFSARLAIALGSVGMLSGCLSSSDSQQVDPVVVENPVAYIERTLLFNDNTGMLVEDNLADPMAFRPEARLYLKTRATPDAETRDISSRAFAGAQFLDDNDDLRYDVKDLHASHDGSRLLFAMRAPEIEDADDEDQPTWNIWEYDVDTDVLRRIIDSDVTARAGQDVAPAYLPDGRIVFSSTRQRISKAVLLDEGKPQYSGLDEEGRSPAFVLHVMDEDGQNIEQITFNQSHDLDPMVASDGTIVFSRWDNAGQTRDNGVNLYRVNPDGTGLSYLYGRHSHDWVPDVNDVQYLHPRKSDSGDLLVQLRPFESGDYASVPIEVNAEQFVEANLRIDGTEDDSGQRPLVPGVGLNGQMSLEGSYASVSPLLDGTNRYLASWTPCRLREIATEQIVNCTEDRLESEDYQPAEPVYGLWLLDTNSETQRPIVPPVEGIQFDEAVLMKDRPLEHFIPESQFTGAEGALGDEGYGILHIRSVYDIDGVDTTPSGIEVMADPVETPPEQRPARFLRLEKPVAIPDENVRDFDNSAYGRSRAQLMREILGYVPIEPDGSVKVAVPANVAFAVSVLDEQGQRISARHQNWLTVRPGDTLECSGCHNPDSPTPHGRSDAGPEPVWGGAATTGREFRNTDTELFADMGETMAEVFARIRDIRRPSPDVVYVDEWSGEAVDPKPESFALSYADLETAPPISGVCAIEWTPNCRIVINYEQHIHPLWSVNREVLDPDTMAVVDDYSCTSCHSDSDAADMAMVPAAQLDLSDGPSPDEPLHFNAYRELLYPDSEQELVNGALIDRLVDSGEVLRDEEGTPILDADGNEQPILVTVPVQASMSVNGARASDFFEVFSEEGTHRDFLTPAELRLISEWLDIGGQYFNNPFDAPAD